MTDSLSMVTSLTKDTETRLASQERDLALLQAGKMRILCEDPESRDISAEWTTRLQEWIASDRAMLQHLRREG